MSSTIKVCSNIECYNSLKNNKPVPKQGVNDKLAITARLAENLGDDMVLFPWYRKERRKAHYLLLHFLKDFLLSFIEAH